MINTKLVMMFAATGAGYIALDHLIWQTFGFGHVNIVLARIYQENCPPGIHTLEEFADEDSRHCRSMFPR